MTKRCAACDFKNDDDADFCARCGAHLADVKARPMVVEEEERGCYASEEEECFGLPHGGAICGLIIGLIIIIWALGLLFSWNIWDYLWPIILVVFGVLIIAGALYAMRQRSPTR